MFQAKGLKKGDVVMLILRRRWEYWITAVGLMKLGVIIVPGTLQLTKKDIAYRANAADIKAFVCVNDPYVCEQMELARPEAPCIREIYVDNEEREGWINFNDEEFMKYPDTFERPTGDQKQQRVPTLCRFTSLPVPPECRKWSATIITTP